MPFPRQMASASFDLCALLLLQLRISQHFELMSNIVFV